MEANGAPYFPGAASLIDQLDTIVSLMLRDSRNLIGKLRSFDQYLNLVLEDTVERIVLSGTLFIVE
jgi:U6 snRNA-associated Sm-like protein LSm1